MHRQQIISRIVTAYLGNVTGARQAYYSDSAYHERIEFMTRLLEIFDLAMDQEETPAGTRYRVLERVMLSTPDPGETQRQMEQMKKLIETFPARWSFGKE